MLLAADFNLVRFHNLLDLIPNITQSDVDSGFLWYSRSARVNERAPQLC